MPTVMNDVHSIRGGSANDRLALYLRLMGVREGPAIQELLADLLGDPEPPGSGVAEEDASREAVVQLIGRVRARCAEIFERALPDAPASCEGLVPWRLRRVLHEDSDVLRRSDTVAASVLEALSGVHASTPPVTQVLKMKAQDLHPSHWYARLRGHWQDLGHRLRGRKHARSQPDGGGPGGR
jgi:hypothetical protein